MTKSIFDEIWYLPEENRWRDMNMLAMRDAGKLSVNGDVIEFSGKKEGVRITAVEQVSYGKQGRDFINNWVKVVYDGGKTAFFRTVAGWAGVESLAERRSSWGLFELRRKLPGLPTIGALLAMGREERSAGPRGAGLVDNSSTQAQREFESPVPGTDVLVELGS